MTILRTCEWTTGETEVPLFHIDEKLNLADLLTKKHELSVESVTLNSEGQNGLPWMRLGHPAKIPFPAENCQKISGQIFSTGKEIFRPENFQAETHFYLICDMAMMKYLMNISNL